VAEVEKRPAFMNELEVTTYWEQLTLNDLPIDNPENIDETLRPSTELEVENIKPKYGFKEIFDCPRFTGLDKNMIHHRNKCARNNRHLSPLRKQYVSSFTAKPREKGGPCSRFCLKYGLDEKSHPADWLDSLLPLTPKDNLEDLAEIDVTGDRKTKFAISNWTSYTAAKARISAVGQRWSD